MVTSKGVTFKSKPLESEEGMSVKPYENKDPNDHEEPSMWRMKDVDANWWPSIMPRVLLSPLGEDEALYAGYDNPTFYLADMKTLEDADKVTDPKSPVDVTTEL